MALQHSTRYWHYVLNDSCLGPIAEQDFMRLVENGKIAPHTEVWYKGLKHWTILEKILPEVDAGKSGKPALNIADPEAPARPGPWLRLLARGLDVLLFLPVMTWLLAGLSWSVRLSDIAFILLAMGAAIVLEALCLSRLGSTPGKSLLGISIKQKSGRNLTFLQALSRSGLAWIMGTGLLCSWAVSLAFLWASYKLLSQRGATLWDMESGHQVRYNPPGFARKLLGLSCMCLFFIAQPVLF